MMVFCADDSGTHKGSRVVVWGGILGYQDFFDELAVAWKRCLAEPCEGRPPISAFHSSHLAASDGEFGGYNRGERDRTRFNFRKAIIESGLTILSLGASAEDWDELVNDHARVMLGSSERLVFGKLILAGCRAAQSENQRLVFRFDAGRRTEELETMIPPALDEANIDKDNVEFQYNTVSKDIGLQAADLVAHETFQFFSEYIDNSDAVAGPHLTKLFEDAHDAKAWWVGRQEIQNLMVSMQAVFQRAQSASGA